MTVKASDGAAVLCREMAPEDLAAVAELLTRGFGRWRDARFWARALGRLATHEPPDGLPRMGYVLQAGPEIVGVLLLVAAEIGGVRRCNVSSWYVEPAFRPFASLLVRRALRHGGVTYLNVTPAPETWPLLAAQGYARYSAGRALALPLLGRSAPGIVRRLPALIEPGPDLADAEITLLRDHAAWGCLSLVGHGPAGRTPFVLGLRRRRRLLPFAYLLYCRDLDSLAQFARPLGRYLLRFGAVLLVADATDKLPGMPGWFRGGFPKFVRGGPAPDPADLAYTERAIFGV